MPRKKATEVLPPEEQPDALAPDVPSDASGSDTPDVPESVQPEMPETTPEFPAALPEASESPPEEETVSDTSADNPEQAVEPPVFLTQDFPTPTFAFSRSGKPYWHNISFTLREVKPHA